MATRTLLDNLAGRKTSRYVRIYEPSVEVGKAVPTDYVRDLITGRVEQRKVTKTNPVAVRTVVRSGCEMCVDGVENLLSNQQNQKMAYNQTANVPTIVAQTTGGGTDYALPQKASAYGSAIGQWSITIENTTATTQELVIGDAVGLIGDFKNIDKLDAGVNIDGTFGAATLAMIKELTRSVPVTLGGIHLEADNSSFYGAGRVSNVVADLENQSPDETPVYFQKKVNSNSFNREIREDQNYVFQINGITGVYVSMPAGRTLTISWDLLGAGKTYLISPNR